MRISCPLTMITLATMALLACVENNKPLQHPDASSGGTTSSGGKTGSGGAKESGGTTGSGGQIGPDSSTQAEASAPPEDFELQGQWTFLGPWDGPHTLTISNSSIVYASLPGDSEDWSSNWKVKDYDNDLHQFEMVFESGTGAYYPVGQNFSGTYFLSGILTIQLKDGLGSYPSVDKPGTCTEDDETRIPDCRLYMKQN